MCFTSIIIPKNVKEALQDVHWVNSIYEELIWLQQNDIQYLISKPKDKHVIVTFWLYKNKKNKNGMISRNNSHLVAQGYTQKEGIDFEEMVTLIIRLESVRLLI